MLEVKQGTIFTFNTVANGQGFSFQIVSDTRAAACLDLLTKLELISKDIRVMLNEVKATAGN